MESEPAYPSGNQVRIGDFSTAGHVGLTKREWFAGMAMAALPKLGDTDATTAEVAHDAVRLADALIAALEPKT